MRPAESSGLPDGPASLNEVHKFLDFVIPRVDTLQESLAWWHGKRIIATSRWSGIGGMDVALSEWAVGMRSRGCDVQVSTYSFTEWSLSAQDLLCKFPCQHICLTINEQFDAKVFDTVTCKQRSLRSQYLDGCKADGMTPAARSKLKKEKVESFKYFLDTIFAGSDCPTLADAACVLHGIDCPLIPDDPDCLWIDMGSPSCKSWSPRGTRMQWLAEDNIGTLMWGHALGSDTRRRPEIIFGENVPDFDLMYWTSLSQDHYSWHSTVLGPHMIGLPVSGNRLWWVGFGRRLSLATAEVLAHERVAKTLFRRIVVNPSMWLIASRSRLEAHEDHINAHGAQLPPHPRGKRVRPEDYLGTAAQCRLLEHRQHACSLRLKAPVLHVVDLFFDISQHVPHSRCPNGWLPRPTTSSVVWSEGLGRMVHPLELWSSQGLPLMHRNFQ